MQPDQQPNVESLLRPTESQESVAMEQVMLRGTLEQPTSAGVLVPRLPDHSTCQAGVAMTWSKSARKPNMLVKHEQV